MYATVRNVIWTLTTDNKLFHNTKLFKYVNVYVPANVAEGTQLPAPL